MYVKVKCVKLPKFILHFQIWALEVPKYVVLMIQYKQNIRHISIEVDSIVHIPNLCWRNIYPSKNAAAQIMEYRSKCCGAARQHPTKVMSECENKS